MARYEEHVAKLDNSSGFIDLFWPGVLIVEQKSAGRKLGKAYDQAGEYFDSLPERDRPRYILVSDFQTLELHDLDERSEVRFGLKDLPDHVEFFSFILGVQKRTFRDQDPANIKAAELVGRLHDALDGAGYSDHDLERFLVRIVFCLFADDTGIFEPRDIFVFGNPPFVGAKLQTQEQHAQVRGIAILGKNGGTLDYVAAWFIKAGEYVRAGRARIGFVATNSITQGEQVAQLWPILFDRCKLEIAFANRTFAWGSDARGKAHVHVVILGLDRRDRAPKEKRLFSYSDINGEPEEDALRKV